MYLFVKTKIQKAEHNLEQKSYEDQTKREEDNKRIN